MDPGVEIESMHFSVLGSGSGGNGAVVVGPAGALLIDAGLSARQTLTRLEEVGIDPSIVRGVLLTHEHGDHTRGLDVLVRGPLSGVPVYANPHTCEVLRPLLRAPAAWRLVETGSFFECAGWRIETFSVPHDAVDPMGFVIEDPGSGRRLGVVSDLGHTSTTVRAGLRELDALFLEANYCAQLLAADTRRPWSTKQRIASRHGHLSNDQAASLVIEILSPRLHHLWLGHLSADCNCPIVATAALRNALASRAADHVEIYCTWQDRPTPLMSIGGGLFPWF
jgi:phosphoribosyl 1,2-cyclic phosphodiesterase